MSARLRECPCRGENENCFRCFGRGTLGGSGAGGAASSRAPHRRAVPKKPMAPRVPCPHCGVSKAGLADHIRAKHPNPIGRSGRPESSAAASPAARAPKVQPLGTVPATGKVSQRSNPRAALSKSDVQPTPPERLASTAKVTGTSQQQSTATVAQPRPAALPAPKPGARAPLPGTGTAPAVQAARTPLTKKSVPATQPERQMRPQGAAPPRASTPKPRPTTPTHVSPTRSAAPKSELRRCPFCNKMRAGLEDHVRAKHGADVRGKQVTSTSTAKRTAPNQSVVRRRDDEALNEGWEDLRDATRLMGFPVRDHGGYGSHPIHDGFDDESSP